MAESIWQYDRIYELIIGDVKKPNEAILIDTSLQITFDISKSIDNKKNGNSASIEIYNLSDETLKKLESQFLGFQFKVGYRDTGLKLLFSGAVTQVTTRKQGADWVTQILAGEGYTELNHAKLKASVPPGKNVEEAIEEIRKQMPNISRGVYTGTNLNSQIVYGYPLTGTPKDMLNALAETYRLEWRVDRGTLYVNGESAISDKNYKNTAFLINQDTGLIDSPFYRQADGRKRKGDKTKREGVQFMALLNAEIVPGSIVALQSRLIEGYYRITEARYSGSFRNGNWIVECFATEILKADIPE